MKMWHRIVVTMELALSSIACAMQYNMTPLQPVYNICSGCSQIALYSKGGEKRRRLDGHTGVEQAMESSQREFQHPSTRPSSTNCFLFHYSTSFDFQYSKLFLADFLKHISSSTIQTRCWQPGSRVSLPHFLQRLIEYILYFSLKPQK